MAVEMDVLLSRFTRDEILKAYIIIGKYEMSELENIFDRSKKTIYRDIKKINEEIIKKFQKKRNKITDIEIQELINYVYEKLFISVHLLKFDKRKELVIQILDNLENKFNLSFIDTNKIYFKELGVYVSLKEKLIYLNTYYTLDDNKLLYNNYIVDKFKNEILHLIQMNFKVSNWIKLTTKVDYLVEEKWLQYKFNILENTLEEKNNKYPLFNIKLKLLFKCNNLFLNDTECENIINIISECIESEEIRLNILSNDDNIIQIVKNQLEKNLKVDEIILDDSSTINIIPTLTEENIYIQTGYILTQKEIDEVSREVKKKLR